MGAMWRHFKTVSKHKWEVFKQCRACGLFWQGLFHDMSKFSIVEFASSARYFQGNRSPIEAEKEEVGYSKAWLHHKGHNKHHWEYWTDFADDGSIIANKMPVKYLIEMVCDWVGAGKVYNKEKWTTESPMIHYKKMRKGRYFHPDTDTVIIHCMELIRDEGLEAFHKYAKQLIKTGY